MGVPPDPRSEPRADPFGPPDVWFRNTGGPWKWGSNGPPPRAPCNNSAPLGGGRGGPTPPHPAPPDLDLPTPALEYWAKFSSGPSADQNIFSGAFGADEFRPKVFFGAFSASNTSAPPEGGIGRGGGGAGPSEAGYGRPVDGGVWTTKTVKRPRQQPAQPPVRQLLGAADAQTAHPATFSTAPAHQRWGSANAGTTPAGALAAAADRTQRPDATCEGKNG